MKHPLVAAFSAVVLLAACPPDEGSATTDAASETTGTALTASAIQGAVCARQAECCPGNETLEKCQARTMAWDNFLTVSNFQVDQTALRGCLDRVAAADCSAVAEWGGVLPLVDWCDPWFTGVAPNGQACGATETGPRSIVRNAFSDRECASGYCEDHV